MQRGEADLRGARRGRGRRRRSRRSVRGRSAGSRSRTSAPRAPGPAGSPAGSPCRPSFAHRVLDQRQLEQDQLALQVGEARARTRAPRSPCRSGRGRVPISRWSRGSKSNSGGSPTTRTTSASSSRHAVRSGRVGQVGELGEQLLDPALDLRTAPARGDLISSASACGLGDRLLGVLARPLGLRDLLGHLLLRGAAAPRPRAAAPAGARPARAARRSCRPRPGARARPSRRPDRCGSALGRAWRRPTRRCCRTGRSYPPRCLSRRLRRQARRARRGLAGVLGDELGDRLGVLADHDVLRHDRAREPAVADRVQDLVLRLAAIVEVRARRRVRSGLLPSVPAASSVWQPAQRSANSVGAAGVDLLPFAAAAHAREGAGHERDADCRCGEASSERHISYPGTVAARGRRGPERTRGRPAPVGRSRLCELACLECGLHYSRGALAHDGGEWVGAGRSFSPRCEDPRHGGPDRPRASSATPAGTSRPASAWSPSLRPRRPERDDRQRGHVALAASRR